MRGRSNDYSAGFGIDIESMWCKMCLTFNVGK